MKKTDWNTGELTDCHSRVPLPCDDSIDKQPVIVTDWNTGQMTEWGKNEHQ